MLRRAGDDFFTPDHNLSFVGREDAGEDVHERRLAGAVLAQECVNLAFSQVEANAVIRGQVTEPLRDAAQRDTYFMSVTHRSARRCGLRRTI